MLPLAWLLAEPGPQQWLPAQAQAGRWLGRLGGGEALGEASKHLQARGGRIKAQGGSLKRVQALIGLATVQIPSSGNHPLRS